MLPNRAISSLFAGPGTGCSQSLETMRAWLRRRLDERRLRWLFALFFLVLAVPAGVLFAEAYRQLRWEALHRAELAAETLAGRIDGRLRAAVAAEEARTFADYSFLIVDRSGGVNGVRPSALAAFPVASALPGVIGYFQVDSAGRLTTPLLPGPDMDGSRFGITEAERNARLAVEAKIRTVLVDNHLVQRPPVAAVGSVASVPSAGSDGPAASAEPAPALRSDLPSSSVRARAAEVSASAASALPNASSDKNVAGSSRDSAVGPGAAFDRLSAAAGNRASARAPAQRVGPLPKAASLRDEALPIAKDEARSAGSAAAAARRSGQTEAAPESADSGSGSNAAEFRVRTFESELDPFEVGLLDSGQLVMFRNAWRDRQRYVQGAVVDRERFLRDAVESEVAASSLARTAALRVTFAGTLLGAAGEAGRSRDRGTLLYRARMSPPFGALELVMTAGALPLGAAGALLGWTGVVLAAVLGSGFVLMYRFAAGQLRLARQQQDFVSAVSHELKTPLTSIRMYGEMLKAGWAEDAKKQMYYEYIHSESERLSRLIENVLQLARLTRRSQRLDLKRVGVAELLEGIRAKIATQAERAGFALELRNDAGVEAAVLVDADCFAQIFINLADNALKFSAGAQRKTVEIACRRERGGLLFTVRDFGPGIPKGQLRKIFELFYRPPGELTRETAGTGIGLALVRELAGAMSGHVEVRNMRPGAEFRVWLPGTESER